MNKKLFTVLCAALVLLITACILLWLRLGEGDRTADSSGKAPDCSAGRSSVGGEADSACPPDGDTEHRFTVAAGEGGTVPAGLDAEINGMYPAGAEIRLIARPHPDFRFDHWESSGGGSFSNPADSGATFTMPACDTTVTAVFVPAKS